MTDSVMQMVTGRKGGKSGGGSARVAQEAPNTLQSKATLKVVEIVSAGEIEGPANASWAKSIYFDDTPLQNADGSYNFQGIAFETRPGTPDQSVIKGFPNVSTETAVGVKVTKPIPIVRTITDADTDAIAVTVRVPALTNQDKTNGDLNGSQVQFKIEYQPSGGSYIQAVSPTQGTIKGKTTSPYQRQYRINLTGNAPWNIRVTRVTDDNTDASIQNDLYWDSYTVIRDHRLIYPDLAIVGLSVDSSLFGSDIPQRSFYIKGIKLQVPSNYDPETREYDGVWDGTFVRAWSDNPAWVLYDLITNNFYGIGHLIDAEAVDKWSLYEIAQYCDELVDNGSGGHESRFTFNGVLQSQEDALKVLQVVASAYRGMLYAGAEGDSAVVTSTYDGPSDAVKIFSPANVIDGMFTYASSPAEAQHSSVYVTWNNPEENFEAAIEVVNSPVISSMITQRQLDIVAYGCTSRGQAHRLGKWILDSELYEDEQVTFSVGLADADLRPGQIVKVFDPAIADIRAGGRLTSATTTDVTLDAPFEIEFGQTYSIDIVMPDGTIETRDITNATGTHTVLSLDSALPSTPDPMTMWAITSSDIAPRLFRVITVKESSPTQYEVLAQLHDPNKYARVEEGINLPTANFTRLASGTLTPPSDITFSEYIFYTGPLMRSAVTVSWKASPDSRVVTYQLEAQAPGDSNYELARQTNGLSHTIEGTVDGTWSFRVRAMDALGNTSAYVELSNQTLQINGQAPADVDGFAINNLVNSSVLSWEPVLSKNLSHYEIRYSSDLNTATWNAAIPVVDRVSRDTTHVVVASRTGTFLIKAVSIPTPAFPQGVYSDNAALVIVDIDFLQNFNFVVDLVEDPSFNGYRDNVELSGAGNLELTEATPGVFNPTGAYYHRQIIDLGDVYTSRVTPNIVAAGNLTTNDVDAWANVDAILNVDGVSDGLWNLESQVSFTQLDPFIPADNGFSMSKDMTNAAWVKENIVSTTANAIAAPDGTITADLVIPSTTSGNHSIRQGFVKSASSAMRVSFKLIAKAAGYTTLFIRAYGGTTATDRSQFYVNLATGEMTTPSADGAFSSPVANVTPLGNGWYEIDFSVITNSDANVILRTYLGGVYNGSVSYAGNGTSGFYLWAISAHEGEIYNPWSPYRALDVGDINARAFRFRTLLWSYFATVTPSIEQLSINIDMPDIIQSGNDIATNPSGDTVVTFPNVFRSSRPAVVITPQGIATGDYIDLDPNNITASGFTFNIRSSGGTRKACTFDYHAKGYGILGS